MLSFWRFGVPVQDSGNFVIKKIFKAMTAQFGNVDCCVVFLLVESKVFKLMLFEILVLYDGIVLVPQSEVSLRAVHTTLL